LKNLHGKYYFIFDTDFEQDTLFDEYEISPVHKRAFLGEYNAGIMNVVDEFGSFNTGAVPIWKDGVVIGIVSTDIEDIYIQESRAASLRNAIILIIAMVISMCVLTIIVAQLLRNVGKMQDELFKMANFDVLTGLPNRQYLMNYLTTISQKAIEQQASFALLLIDLDNFKTVNDNAGHDAGDELLRDIATYIDSMNENSKSFRPPPGLLNVSARIGGDEFIQIVNGVESIEEVEDIAKKLLDNFHTKINNRYVEKYQVGLSIGAALFPFHTENYNVLIKYADIAMYHAKSGGKGAYCIYSGDLHHVDKCDKPPAERREFRR